MCIVNEDIYRFAGSNAPSHTAGGIPMKRKIALVLVLALALALCACGSRNLQPDEVQLPEENTQNASPEGDMNQIKMKAGNATAGTHEPPASVPLRKNMICNNCGTKLPDGALFCTNCGKKVVALPATNYCRFCGAKVEEHSKFCPQCGKSLA